MGVTNFDNLPQNLPQTMLGEARQVARERKGSSQRVAGANLRYFRVDNTGEFVWSGRVDTQSVQSSSTGFAFFIITLTSSVAPVFLARVVAEYFESNDSGATWTAVVLVGSPFTRPPMTVRPLVGIEVEPYESKWLVSIIDDYNDYRAFKIQALATDLVSIGVERVL